jgi:hypothetical protein
VTSSQRLARPARGRRRVAGAALAALVAAVAPAVAGCDPQQLGAAAIVDGDQITIAGLQDEVMAYQASLGDDITAPADDATLQRAMLNRQIVHRLYQDVAAANDVEVTPAEIDGFLADFREGTDDVPGFLAERGLTEQTAPEAVFDALAGQKLVAKLGDEAAVNDAVGEAATAADIWVNPRYGTWQAGGVQAVSGSISQPAEG